MAYKFRIIRAQPNPVGKDRFKNFPLPSQLLGEWVDLKNEGDGAGSLASICLAHREFNSACSPVGPAQSYWYGVGEAATTVLPGQIVRVHTGRRTDQVLMAAHDQQGVDYHAFADSGNFVLNNECGDSISVWWNNAGTWEPEDAATYARHPGEGAILIRFGDKLVPTPFR